MLGLDGDAEPCPHDPFYVILVQENEAALPPPPAPVNRRYAGMANARGGRSGHFWQGRYGAAVLDEAHLAEAFKYVLLNPVRARLALRAADWRWSSARAYLKGIDDGLTRTADMLARFPDLAGMLDAEIDAEALAALRRAETIGRPVGDADFLARLEARTRRRLVPQKRGRKPGGGKDALSL
jgi:putative transposase